MNKALIFAAVLVFWVCSCGGGSPNTEDNDGSDTQQVEDSETESSLFVVDDPLWTVELEEYDHVVVVRNDSNHDIYSDYKFVLSIDGDSTYLLFYSNSQNYMRSCLCAECSSGCTASEPHYGDEMYPEHLLLLKPGDEYTYHWKQPLYELSSGCPCGDTEDHECPVGCLEPYDVSGADMSVEVSYTTEIPTVKWSEAYKETASQEFTLPPQDTLTISILE